MKEMARDEDTKTKIAYKQYSNLVHCNGLFLPMNTEWVWWKNLSSIIHVLSPHHVANWIFYAWVSFPMSLDTHTIPQYAYTKCFTVSCLFCVGEQYSKSYCNTVNSMQKLTLSIKARIEGNCDQSLRNWDRYCFDFTDLDTNCLSIFRYW